MKKNGEEMSADSFEVVMQEHGRGMSACKVKYKNIKHNGKSLDKNQRERDWR